MKWNCAVRLVAILSLLSFESFAQNEAYTFIRPSNLTITCNKTTNLIFPFTVQSVDRGSKDILVQQPKGTENIVQVKADKPNFLQTNLSVITVDGSLYSFTVDYAVQPSQLNIVVKPNDQTLLDSSGKQTVQLSSGNNEALFKTTALKINNKKIIRGRRIWNDQIQFSVCGIYVHSDIIYFRLQIKNHSNISYETDNFRFSVKNRQQSRRTATQELELKPVYTYNAFGDIPTNTSATCIIAIPKFTLPDSRYLSVDVLEKNGSRDLHLRLKKHHLANAKIIGE